MTTLENPFAAATTRAKRRAGRVMSPCSLVLKRRLPLTEPMDQDQIERIDAASMYILETVGVVFRDEIAL